MGRVFAFFRTGKGLSTFAALTLAWMLLVVLEGAVVRATGSGAGCGQHWPLCNGQILPHHPRLATVIEFAHRSMTGICSALTVALVTWTFLAQRRSSPARKAAVISGLLLIVEALLGALLVLGGFVEHNTSNLRVLVQGIHFTNTLLLLGALSLTWWWLRPRSLTQGMSSSTLRLALAAAFAIVLAGATGSVAALADTLFPSPNLHSAMLADLDPTSPLLIRMRWIHPAASLVASLLIVWLAARHRPSRKLLVTLLAAQFILGLADVILLAPLTLQVLHLLAGNLLWISLVVLIADARRSPALIQHPSSPEAAGPAGTVPVRA